MYNVLDLTSEKNRDIFVKNIKKDCQAYRDFLANIKTNNWSEIPLSDKNSYFKKYSLEEKIYSGFDLADFYMVCTSSGSTGEPTLWPRDISLDDKAEYGHTKYLDEHFNVLSKKTLIVISFGMGTATAGLLHAKLSWEANRKGKITTITPGDDIDQAILLVEKLKKFYEQVVFIGYPPLIKEILETSVGQNIDIKKWNVKIATAGAGMTAKWRKEIAMLISPQYKLELNRVVSFFGCTETGMLGMETKTVNKIINICIENEEIRKDLFGTMQLPTIVELTIPNKYVEIVEDELVLSVDQPIPLLRYNVHDRASFISFNYIKKVLENHNININSEGKDKKYLIVYGRKEKGYFSVEDFKLVLDEVNSKDLLQEFQFKEEIVGSISEVELILYQTKKISEKGKKSITKLIEDLLHQKQKLKLQIIWKSSYEKIGFLSGKLKYYI